MRLHLSRTTAFVALIAAVMAVSGAAPPRQGGAPGRDRDRVLRTTRGGPQRLDAADGVAHNHDDHELAPAPPGDGRLVAGTPAASAPHTTTLHPAILAGAFFTPPARVSAPAHAVDGEPAPRAAWLYSYAPDRAPPLA